jgi:aminopeptidase N
LQSTTHLPPAWRFRWHWLLASLLIAPLCLVPLHAQAPALTQPTLEPLRTAGDRPIDIKHIKLELAVDLKKRTVEGKATLTFRTMRQLASFELDAVEFEVTAVKLRRDRGELVAIPHRHDGRKLAVALGQAWEPDTPGTLEVTYRVRQPRDGLFFFGPTPTEPEVPWMVWSQGEAITNRYWFPSLDHPAQRQTTELIVTVEPGFEVISNGKLISHRINADKSETYHWKQELPHVSYLVTLVVGQFDTVKEDWRGKEVSYHVPKGRGEAIARTFGRTREMLDFFVRRFGIDYPWERYAQVVVEQFTAGGMENTGATTLTDRALHDERAFLDSDADLLIAHELGHQWWGDLVTCRDWAHLWLNEGFATFCEVIWIEHAKGADEAAYLLVQKARSAIAGGKERPIVDRRYAAPRLMFDARAYPKGAWVLQMLRHRLGEKQFWQGVQNYGTEYRLQSVETHDLRRVLEKTTGHSLERFFYDWTERPGHPVVEITPQYDAEAKQLRLSIKQTQAAEPFHFPLKLVFNQAGAAKPTTLTVAVQEREHLATVPLAERPSGIWVDPEQAVLAEWNEVFGRDLLAEQLQRGPVPCRIRAAEQLGKSKLPADRDLLSRALTEESFWGVAVEIANALGQSGGEVCRDALIAGLQHKHPKVRRAAASNLGLFRNDARAAEALRGLLKRGDPSYFVEAAAIASYAKLGQADAVNVLMPWLARASHNEVLRIAALNGLADTKQAEVIDPLIQWTKRGRPRLTRIAALDALGKLAVSITPTTEQQKAMVQAITACIEGETPPVRRAAVAALRDFGRTALPSIETLEALIRHEADDRIVELARRTIEAIRRDNPLPAELTRLREELDRLRRLNQQLSERLDRMERRGF